MHGRRVRQWLAVVVIGSRAVPGSIGLRYGHTSENLQGRAVCAPSHAARVARALAAFRTHPVQRKCHRASGAGPALLAGLQSASRAFPSTHITTCRSGCAASCAVSCAASYVASCAASYAASCAASCAAMPPCRHAATLPPLCRHFAAKSVPPLCRHAAKLCRQWKRCRHATALPPALPPLCRQLCRHFAVTLPPAWAPQCVWHQLKLN